MKKSFLSAFLGNLFEHYDAALFGLLSPFLAPFIFPDKDPTSALILTYAMIPMGMLARPFGALVFGFIGDRRGRGYALFITLLGMGVVSLGIGLCPTYVQGGILAPILFCLGRILQNFFAAGETMGGAIFLLDQTQEKKHDLFSSLFCSSTIGGILLASAGVSFLSYLNIISTGWRILYFFGTLTALFGCLIRRYSVQEYSAHLEQVRFSKSVVNWGKQLYMHRKYLLSIVIVSGFGYANASISLVLLNGFIPLISSITKSQMLHLNTILLILDFCALPLFGFLSSKISREKMMLGACFCVVLGAVPAFMLLSQATLVSVVCVRVCFVLIGVAFFAPFHAWAQQLVPASSRYVIISFGYALGSQLLGGPTAALSLWCFKKTGMAVSVAGYWIFLALLSGVVVAMSLKREKMSLERA